MISNSHMESNDNLKLGLEPAISIICELTEEINDVKNLKRENDLVLIGLHNNVANKDKIIMDLNDNVSELQKSVVEQDQMIIDLRKELEAKIQKVEELTAVIATKDRNVNDLASIIDINESLMIDTRKLCDKLMTEVRAKEQLVGELKVKNLTQLLRIGDLSEWENEGALNTGMVNGK